jgi:hypothetical protein
LANGLVSSECRPALLTAIVAWPHLAQNLAPSVKAPPHRPQILFVMFFSFLIVKASDKSQP